MLKHPDFLVCVFVALNAGADEPDGFLVDALDDLAVLLQGQRYDTIIRSIPDVRNEHFVTDSD